MTTTLLANPPAPKTSFRHEWPHPTISVSSAPALIAPHHISLVSQSLAVDRSRDPRHVVDSHRVRPSLGRDTLGAPSPEASHGLNRPSDSHGVFRARLTLVRIYSTPAVGSDSGLSLSHMSSPCASRMIPHTKPSPSSSIFFVVRSFGKRMKKDASGSRMLLKVLTSRLFPPYAVSLLPSLSSFCTGC